MCNCVQDYHCWVDAKSIFLFIGDRVENSVTELYVCGGGGGVVQVSSSVSDKHQV